MKGAREKESKVEKKRQRRGKKAITTPRSRYHHFDLTTKHINAFATFHFVSYLFCYFPRFSPRPGVTVLDVIVHSIIILCDSPYLAFAPHNAINYYI